MPKEKNVVDERWQAGSNALKRDVKNYWINTSFLVGEQWITYSNTENAIRRIEPDPRRSRVTRNRIKRSVRVNLGKMLKNALDFDVSPDSADDAAVKGAELARTALTDVKDRQNWEKLRSAEVLSTFIGGTAGLSIEWDPAGYKAMGETESGKSYGVGEVCGDSLSIIEMVCEPGVEDAELGRWWIKQTAEDPEEAARRYGLAEIPEPDATTAFSAFEQRIVGASATMSGASRSYEGRVLVRTMFERPSKKLPKGRIVTVIAGNTVQEKDWYFPFTHRLNLVVFRDFPMDGRWTGEAMITDAIPIQTEINLARSVIAEHLKKAGNARLWIPDTSIDEDDLTDDPGQPVFYQPIGGAKPEWSSPPPLPAWEVNYPEQAAAEIDDILGVHDISRGQAQPGLEAGVAISMLAERDDTPLGVFARDQAEGWGRYATMALELYAKFLTEPRKLAISPQGAAGATAPKPYSVDFSGKELHGQTKATVPLEVMAPRSRAAQQAWASSLLQMGALGTPPDMRLFARLADLPNKDMVLAALSSDADRAQRENEKMFRDLAAEPRDYDNHGVHIAEHNAARKSERYERLSSSEKNLFDMHVKAHETMAAEEAGRQEMKAMESANLAGAAQGNETPGSGVPPAAADQLASQGAPPPPFTPNPMAAAVDQQLPAGPANTFGEGGTP